MNNLNFLCEQFAKILNGKSNINQGVCSVSLRRNIKVLVQGRPSTSVIPVGIARSKWQCVEPWRNRYFTRRNSFIYAINCSTRDYC